MASNRAKTNADTGFYLTNQSEATHAPPRAAEWPIVRGYVPLRDAWLASGFGSAGIIRQQPDGRQSLAVFTFSLVEQGIKMMFGKGDLSPKDGDEMLASIKKEMPPWEEGPAERAAIYIRGALALGEKYGHYFPPQESARWMSHVPHIRGTSKDHLRRFIGPGGVAPPGLWNIARRYASVEDEIPEDKEVLIFTTMTFVLTDAGEAIRVLAREKPEFQLMAEEGRQHIFDWSREYPEGHWSPLSRLGGRQSLGTVRVGHQDLVADVKSLSWAARLVARLKDLLGDRIHLRGATWAAPPSPLPDRGRTC